MGSPHLQAVKYKLFQSYFSKRFFLFSACVGYYRTRRWNQEDPSQHQGGHVGQRFTPPVLSQHLGHVRLVLISPQYLEH